MLVTTALTCSDINTRIWAGSTKGIRVMEYTVINTQMNMDAVITVLQYFLIFSYDGSKLLTLHYHGSLCVKKEIYETSIRKKP
jgi:hypothetical protein